MTNILDVRDLIQRYEDLEQLKVENTDNPGEDGCFDEADNTELQELEKLLDELKGCGGDEQWKGDWYPITLIDDSYFEDYAKELAEDIGAINANATWPNNCIDWEQAASELKVDYSTVEYQGTTYWYR